MQTRSMSIKSAQLKNPLYVPEITDHMFKFLTLADIKNCRSVCHKWNQLAEKFLKKLSVVNIFSTEDVEKFNEEFPNSQQSQIFTCFRFDSCQFPVYKFASFCKKWYSNLSELAISSPDFVLGKQNQTYDVSPLLPSTLIKLHIECFCANNNNIMIVSIDKVPNIRILQLECCVLNIIPGTTLKNCVEIELHDVTFREGKENIEEFLINPLLNFDVLKKANFSGETIKLDAQGSHSLDMLSLGEVPVLNWETSNWEIKKLSLYLYPGGEGELWKSQMKYKKLETELIHLNVSLLSESIEKLKVIFGSDEENLPRISGKHNYPHLKHLHIIFETAIDFSPFVEEFKHSPQLVTLAVSLPACYVPVADDASILKTSAIPPSVKTLRAKDVRIILDQSFELESLIVYYALKHAQHKSIVQVANDLHLKNLVCVLIHDESMNDQTTNISDNERGNFIKSLIDLNFDTFVVGHFPQVDNSAFEKSYLFPLVDTQGTYYLFQRGENGKAISDRDAKIYRKTGKKN